MKIISALNHNLNVWFKLYRNSQFNPVNFLIYLSILVGTFGILFTSYLGVSYSEGIGSLVEDDWCDSSTQGVGLHCFSDYYSVVEIKRLDSAWSRGSTYPPFAILIAKIFSSLETFSPRAGLLMYLTTALICVFIPFFHLNKVGLIKDVRNSYSIGILLICSGPVVAAFDRGNNVLFLFPLVYFIYYSNSRDNQRNTLWLIAVAALIKPQMLLFYLVPLINGKIKGVVLGFICYFSINGLLFLLFPGDFIENISLWIGNLQGYQTYPGMPSLGNYSFANAVGLIIGSVKVVFGISTVGEVFRPGISSTLVSILSLSYLIVLALLLFRFRKQINSNIQILIISMTVIVVPGTTFGYYLILLLIPLIFIILRNPQENEHISLSGKDLALKLNAKSKVTLSTLLMLAIPLWPFQWGMLHLDVKNVWNHYGVIPTVVGAFLWTIPFVLLSNRTKKE